MGEGGVGEGERGKIDGRLTGDEGITIDPWRIFSCIDRKKVDVKNTKVYGLFQVLEL